MCIHEGGLAFVKKNCEILWWNNFHFCHIVFIVHSWLGIEGFLSFVWCRCCGAESGFRRLYFPTLLLTITWGRERGLSRRDKECMSSSDLDLIYSGRWGRGGKEGRRRQEEKIDGRGTEFCSHIECPAWAITAKPSLSVTHSCCSRGSIIFTLHRRKKEVETWEE